MIKTQITRTVYVLSLVSFFTDAASEMLYPVMPLYLKTIGFSVLLIGILEGFAEATAGLSKGYFGRWSDLRAKRLPFIQLGYALSALSKPMMAIFTWPLWIFFSRSLDKFGKGIRTGARDALLSEEATRESKGSVFGFHRAMDTFGAAVGPSLALLYLYLNPEDYHTLFFLALVPGALSVAATFLIKEKPKPNHIPQTKRIPLSAVYAYWKTSSVSYKRVVGGFLAFAVINSSDVFLLLKAKEAGFSDALLIGMYIFYNLVYALAAYPLGRLSDRLGLRNVFVFGMAVFAAVYLLMTTGSSSIHFIIAFLLYGLYSASTYGITKAWISNISPIEDMAAAQGTYAGFQSVCALLASSLAGFLWYQFGSNATFFTAAFGAIAVGIYFSTGLKSHGNAVQKVS